MRLLVAAVLSGIVVGVLYREARLAAQDPVPLVSIRQVETEYGQDGREAKSTGIDMYLDGRRQVVEMEKSFGERHRFLYRPLDNPPVQVHAMLSAGLKMTQRMGDASDRAVAVMRDNRCRGESDRRRDIFGYEVFGRVSLVPTPDGSEVFEAVSWRAPALGCIEIEHEQTRILPSGRRHAVKSARVTALEAGAPEGVFEEDPRWVETPTGDAIAIFEKPRPDYAEWIRTPAVQDYLRQMNDAYFRHRP